MVSEDDLILRPADARVAGYCVDGVRKWFAEKGLDFRAFCRGELSAVQIRAVTGDDAMLDRVIAVALQRAEASQNGG